MKVQLIRRRISYHEYQVELETDEEKTWSDSRLITSVDSGAVSDEIWEQIVSGERHPGHFGGVVTPLADNKRLVKVYVD